MKGLRIRLAILLVIPMSVGIQSAQATLPCNPAVVDYCAGPYLKSETCISTPLNGRYCHNYLPVVNAGIPSAGILLIGGLKPQGFVSESSVRTGIAAVRDYSQSQITVTAYVSAITPRQSGQYLLCLRYGSLEWNGTPAGFFKVYSSDCITDEEPMRPLTITEPTSMISRFNDFEVWLAARGPNPGATSMFVEKLVQEF